MLKGDNLKINSKSLGVLLTLLAAAMVISAVSAVDLANTFDNDNFGIDVLSGTNFTETVNITNKDMNLVIFENSGNDSSDVNSIIYFKDSTSDKSEINSFIKDLEDGGSKVEETDKYVVLKNNQNSHDFDIDDVDDIFSFVGSIFSSDGLNLSADGNSISFSSNGLEISDANGGNVSITSEGVNVSEGFDNETVNVSDDVDSNIENCDYSIYLKSQSNDKVIVIYGNNLELLKAMSETVSFNEN